MTSSSISKHCEIRRQRRGDAGLLLVCFASVSVFLCGCFMCGCAQSHQPSTPPATFGQPDLPYVYTEWEQFTTKDGLPNDHIFAVATAGDNVWIGTEEGLACLNKKTRATDSWPDAP